MDLVKEKESLQRETAQMNDRKLALEADTTEKVEKLKNIAAYDSELLKVIEDSYSEAENLRQAIKEQNEKEKEEKERQKELDKIKAKIAAKKKRQRQKSK